VAAAARAACSVLLSAMVEPIELIVPYTNGTFEYRQAMSLRLEKLAERIDAVSTAVGRAVAWCLLFMVLAEFALVLMRYVLGVGSIWLQESVIYAHAALFMLAAAWTLAADGHVRVDIFYADASARSKAVVDLLGALLLLLPFALTLLILSWGYTGRSWMIFEGSRETSGMPAVFLLKSLIPLFAALLALQGLAQALRAALVLAGAAVRAR
jgi:TRAP-type mannitol/chloroaromatic compound transport system permease small subunit